MIDATEQAYTSLTQSEDEEKQVTAGNSSSFSPGTRESDDHCFRSKILDCLPTLALVMLASLFSFLLGYESQPPHHHDFMHQLRHEAAVASLQIMKNDTVKAASESYFIDIGPLADVVDKALDLVGFRRVFLELFETYNFTAATLEAAKTMGVKDFRMETTHEVWQRPVTSLYSGVPSDRWTDETDVCTGCLPALHHWVGAISADKLLRDGSLLLDPTTGERLSTPRDVIVELQRMTKDKEYPPDMVPFHSQHGFIWQYVPSVTPDFFDVFPADLAVDMCSYALVYEKGDNRTFSIVPRVDVVRECRHGFGHAVYYELAMRQVGRKRQDFSARTQFRARGGFILSDEHLCDAVRMCKGAPGLKTYHHCVYGVKHAYYEVSLGRNMSVHSKDVMENVCGFVKTET